MYGQLPYSWQFDILLAMFFQQHLGSRKVCHNWSSSYHCPGTWQLTEWDTRTVGVITKRYVSCNVSQNFKVAISICFLWAVLWKNRNRLHLHRYVVTTEDTQALTHRNVTFLQEAFKVILNMSRRLESAFHLEMISTCV